eukprot:m.199901 g.199901  ORF g.199901 m.199901 type:complete len:662 (-) comp17046_c0_seq4:1850-3835(-)
MDGQASIVDVDAVCFTDEGSSHTSSPVQSRSPAQTSRSLSSTASSAASSSAASSHRNSVKNAPVAEPTQLTATLPPSPRTLSSSTVVASATPNDLALPAIITLNVGGTLFQTTPTTLLWPGPDTFLAVLLSGRLPSTRDATGAYFIDRDPALFRMLLSYLRTRRAAVPDHEVRAVRFEAEYFGLTELARRLSIAAPSQSCGGLLYDSTMGPFDNADGPVVAMASANTTLAVAHQHVVTCWTYSEATGWILEQRSACLATPITAVAISARASPAGTVMIAVASTDACYLWQYHAEPTRDPRPYSPPAREARGRPRGRDRDPDPAPRLPSAFQTFELGSQVDDVFFINGNLLALSTRGRIGVRNARTHVWQVQVVAEISSYAVAGNSLLLGSSAGIISLVDLEKFPLRLKDNDLLVSTLYTDPGRAPITAMSVYETTLASSERCMEIAYGTALGSVRVILQHPETVGQAPMLYQTFLVHEHAVTKVVLSERSLVSVCDNDNHVRSWRIARFRGRISTQPGSQGVGSFSVPTAGVCAIGPYGDLDQQQLFIQQSSPTSHSLMLRLATTGEELCTIESVRQLAITTSYLHEGGMASRVGSRSRRFLCTGHEDGSVQMWDLTSALDNIAQYDMHGPVVRETDPSAQRAGGISRGRRWSSITSSSLA